MHRTPSALFIFALALAACDDPAPVGVDLVDEQSGAPYVLDLSAPDVTPGSFREVTGNATRALVGAVDDPVLGRLEAQMYVDFASISTLTQVFENNPVTDAAVMLVTTYVYGDSTADTPVRLRSMAQSWVGSGATSDTTLQVGDLLTESVENRRTFTMEVPLPQTWVARWDTTLRGTTFDDSFHGFEVTAPDASSILGIEILGTSLRAVAGGDTAYFPVARSITRYTHAPQPDDDGDAFTLQDGRKRTAAFRFTTEEVRETLLLNRGVIRVPADTSLSINAPPHFVRPAISQLQLDWITTGGVRLPIALANRTGGHFDFQSVQLHDSLRAFLQGGSTLEHLEVRVPDSRNGISVVRIPKHDPAPRALLTVTPIR